MRVEKQAVKQEVDDDVEKAAPSGLSAYEIQRLENIKRNEAQLKKIGLATKPKEKKKALKSKKRKEVTAIPPERRSKRLKGAEVDYTSERIDNWSEEQEEREEQLQERKKATVKLSTEAILEKSRQWLKDSKEELLKRAGLAKGSGAIGSKQSNWRQQAVKRWGAKVEEVEVTDWEAFVVSRLSKVPPRSPAGLMQEDFAACPWKLLVSCVLMSRVSSHETKTRVIAAFFARYPTPSHVLDADPAEALPLMNPLGLFDNRFRSVVAISQSFVSKPVFEIGMSKELKVYGVGQFTFDSYCIFCRDMGREMAPDDSTLKTYTSWLKKQPKNLV